MPQQHSSAAPARAVDESGHRSACCPQRDASAMRRVRRQPTRVSAVLIASALVIGCSGSSGGDDALASAVDDSTPTTQASDPTTTEPAATDEAETDDNETTGDPATTGIEIDTAWLPLLEPRFVSQAPMGSIVNLYAEPDSDSEIVGSVLAGETGITLYDVTEEIDGRRWSPVQTSSGVVGWMKNGLLRPEPSVSPPERIGDSSLRGSDTLRQVTAGLSAPEVLAGQIDERGLTMSSDAYIGDDAVVLSADQLRTPAADDTTVLTWGLEAGVGEPIEATMTERFRALAGSTAVTSTEAVGFDVQVGVGNIPSNITEVFPGAEWVELHFSGTEEFGGLDWESVTFVFDTSGDDPILLAITHASWSP